MSDYVSKKAIRYKLDVKTEKERDYIWNKIFNDYNFKNDYNLKHDNDIKSIVTKECFERCEYKAGDDKE